MPSGKDAFLDNLLSGNEFHTRFSCFFKVSGPLYASVRSDAVRYLNYINARLLKEMQTPPPNAPYFVILTICLRFQLRIKCHIGCSQNVTLDPGMTMLAASDAQHDDFGAIEAAVKETARGRAFLANFARRVQQSDTLTMLAMLSRLERVSSDLASRFAELAGSQRPAPNHMPAFGGQLHHRSTLVGADDRNLSGKNGLPEALIDPHADARCNTDVNDRNGRTMQRIEELAVALGTLHRQAAQLASGCDGQNLRDERVLDTSFETNARAMELSENRYLPQPPASEKDPADSDVLDDIAKALGPMS
jgi:hypothetical protein